MICLLESPIEKAVIINSNDYSKKIIQINNTNLIVNDNFFNSIFFSKYQSLYFKGDYFLSFNQNIDLIQWCFDFSKKEFMPLDNLSLNYIRNNKKYFGNKDTIIQKVLFFQQINSLIALTNDNLIFCIQLET